MRLKLKVCLSLLEWEGGYLKKLNLCVLKGQRVRLTVQC